ncbi:MAG: 50S ribosomal protein L22 [Actinomycetota bacterium]|jgi:large subunit ribosomal protein L22|nr:50S ribosomal protein L22 [Actinomycetota bacterium]
MPGPKTNERPGTRAVLRYAGTSAYKVRQVVDLVRGKPVAEAEDVLRTVGRGAALMVAKLVHSAASNAVNNDHMDPDELYVSACYVDEGPTAKRWRPRARGRATRIRKRSCHVTVIVSRMPENELARLQARRRAENLAMRARRVEATRRARSQADGASRRERRHPEAYPVPEGAGAEEVAETEQEAPSGQEAAPEQEAATDQEALPEEALPEEALPEAAAGGTAEGAGEGPGEEEDS